MRGDAAPRRNIRVFGASSTLKIQVNLQSPASTGTAPSANHRDISRCLATARGTCMRYGNTTSAAAPKADEKDPLVQAT